MNNRTSIPPDILATAKRLYPYATLPNKPGEGIAIASFFIGEPLNDILYYFATVKGNDGRYYLVYNFVEEPRTNVLINVPLHSPYLYKIWDENGVILQWTSVQNKYSY